jgi:hypothetical protein
MGGNGFWTFLKCPKIKSPDSTPKILGKKALVTEMLSFWKKDEKCCDANFLVFFCADCLGNISLILKTIRFL